MGRRPGRKPAPTPLGTAIRRLRQELDISEADFGRPSGLSGAVVHNLEKGWRTEPTREEAEKLIAAGLQLPPIALDLAEGFGRWVQAAAPSPEPLSVEDEDVRRCELAAGVVGQSVARKLAPLLLRQLSQMRDERFAEDRRRAEKLCPGLRDLATWEERRERIRSAEDFHSWACVEWLGFESERAAADSASKAIEWAKLGLLAASFVPGPESRRKRLEAWATFHLGNALRVKTDHRGSDQAFTRAWKLWKAGKGDELPLDEGRPYDLEASLRREQRRFSEALELLDFALRLSPAKGRILLKKAATLDQMGDVEAALEALQEAQSYIEESGEPRDLKVLLFNRSVALRKLGHLTAAGALVPAIREVVLQLGGNELDLARTLWNEALIDAGAGRIAKATAALEQVLDEMVGQGLPYEAALAGMDLAVVHLEEGHTREVLFLAGRMEQVFRAYGIDREALAALLVFSEAARRESATVELARWTAAAIAKQRKAPRLPRLYEREGSGEPQKGLGLLTAAAAGVHAAAGIPGRGASLLSAPSTGVRDAAAVQGRGRALPATSAGVHDAAAVQGRGRALPATSVGVHDAAGLTPQGDQLVPELCDTAGSSLLALPGLGEAPGRGKQDDENETRNARESGHDGLLGTERPPRGHHGREGQFPDSMVLENSRQGEPKVEALLAAVLVQRLHQIHGSFERVAQEVGVSRRTLWTYMAGRCAPSRETLAKLGAALGIPAQQLERIRRLLRFRSGHAWTGDEFPTIQPLAGKIVEAVLDAVEEAGALLDLGTGNKA